MIPPRPQPTVALCRRAMTVRLAAPRSFQPTVLVGVTMRNEASDRLWRCLESVVEQDAPCADVGVVILRDIAGREPSPIAHLPAAIASRVWWVDARCGNAARARNAGIAFVEANISSARWIARLDVDDRLATPNSLGAIVKVGDANGAKYVVGGNRVISQRGVVERLNLADERLLHRDHLLTLLEAMAHGRAPNELPSCNLLLAAGQGLRYPEYRSAEDHWLVASLLMFDPDGAAVLPEPLYADYTLNGPVTSAARRSGAHSRSRANLAASARRWKASLEAPGEILGFGNEGVVRREGNQVVKDFYPDALTFDDAERLTALLRGGGPHARTPHLEHANDGNWRATYEFVETRPATSATAGQVESLLLWCLEHRVVFANVKRSNFRVAPDGALHYIDVGKWILRMDVSYFLDAAARMYAIYVLGWDDDELLRRPVAGAESWGPDSLPGFAEFYGALLTRHAHRCWNAAPRPPQTQLVPHDNVTLLIKACAMDARYARHQVLHIVDQLCGPARLHARVVVIDPYEGPFTRQHDVGDLPRLLEICAALLEEGWIDEVWRAPLDPTTVSEVHARWFDIPCPLARTEIGVPVAPQLWAFDQITTRYVLQADLDVLVGRRDQSHDPIADMVAACTPDDVLGVAFNIPHSPPTGWRDYFAPTGDFVPEVRLGLLDLHRVRAVRPLPNGVENGHLTTTWYRSLHQLQRERDLRTVRGGDSRTFYLHPPNNVKALTLDYHRVRDLVAQGRIPEAQLTRWDVEVPPREWRYAPRAEDVVIYASGRNTPQAKVARFMAGLRAQHDQTFGVIIVDDDSSGSPRQLQNQSSWLGDRLTLVRTSRHQGRMANLVHSLRALIARPDTLVVIVDLDDALMDRLAMGKLSSLRRDGHDVVLAAPFRPDVPIRLYQPDVEAPRSKYGGDVWMHLRAYRRSLFDRLPDALLQDEHGEWLTDCTDYATMIPITELSRRPAYIPAYHYWHERTTPCDTASRRRARDMLILDILGRSLPG